MSMTHTTQVLSDEQIIDLAVEHNLGRKLRPFGDVSDRNVFYTDASYRTSELLEFTNAAVSATLKAASGQEPVAWRDPTNRDPGQGCTYENAMHQKWPHIFRQPLFALPPAQPAPVDEALRSIQKKMADFIHLANHVGINDADGFYLAHAIEVEEQARAALQCAQAPQPTKGQP